MRALGGRVSLLKRASELCLFAGLSCLRSQFCILVASYFRRGARPTALHWNPVDELHRIMSPLNSDRLTVAPKAIQLQEVLMKTSLTGTLQVQR